MKTEIVDLPLEGSYLCPQCRKQMGGYVKRREDGLIYQMNVCNDCCLRTGPIDRAPALSQG